MTTRSCLLVVILVVSMAGCNKSVLPKEALGELIQKQQKEHLAIGWLDGQKLEIIIFGTKPDTRDYTLTAEEAQAISVESQAREKPAEYGGGSDAQHSPDGKWITYRTRDNKFVLADSSGRIQKTLLDGDQVLTPLYWSPHSEYLMYVEKAGAWESGPCARNLADGKDIMVYRLRDGQRGLVYQVCEGFPYTRFGWLQVPRKLQLSRVPHAFGSSFLSLTTPWVPHPFLS